MIFPECSTKTVLQTLSGKLRETNTCNVVTVSQLEFFPTIYRVSRCGCKITVFAAQWRRNICVDKIVLTHFNSSFRRFSTHAFDRANHCCILFIKSIFRSSRVFIKVGLGICRTNADSQWNLVYNAFHRNFCRENETICQ